jgi:hypothetical protein
MIVIILILSAKLVFFCDILQIKAEKITILVNNLSDFAEFRQVFGEIFQICAKLKDKIRQKCKVQNRINFGKQGGGRKRCHYEIFKIS